MRSNDWGQSTIETVLLGLFFLVPLVWLLSTLSDIHLAALATTNAAREAGFEASRDQDLAAAKSDVQTIVAQTFRNHGLRPERADVSFTSGESLTRGADIEIVVDYPVPVLQLPFLGEFSQPSMHIEAHHVARVDLYRSRT